MTMCNSLKCCYLCLWAICCVLLHQSSGLDTILVDLSKTQPGKNTSVYKNYTPVSALESDIKIVNINPNISFFIIQLHTYVENITLSYDPTVALHSHVNGTNVGLFWSSANASNNNNNRKNHEAVFYLFRHTEKGINAKLLLLLVISTYEKDDPIPGGCNMSFETDIAPYQKISYNNETITVKSQPASISGTVCSKNNNVTTEMYHMYLNEYDNTETSYFNGIEMMLTVENIRKYGTKVPFGLGLSKFKQVYNLYMGTGEVFGIVCTHKGRSSAYIPGVSFGCNLDNWDEECIGPVSGYWKLVCAILLIVGTFICFCGHRFFRIALFVVGYTFGTFATYVMITLDDDFSSDGKTLFSLITGTIYACFWTFLWWKFGSPLLSINLTFLITGIIFASIFFYGAIADWYVFSNDYLFWFCFLCIVTVAPIIGICFVIYSHIIALSFVGSFSAVIAMNYYVGGNLQYIIINTFRRLTVKHFNMVIINPPYQVLDVWQTIIWLILFALGCYIQIHQQKGKSPFPPHRNGVDIRPPLSERTPLIQPEIPARPQYT